MTIFWIVFVVIFVVTILSVVLAPSQKVDPQFRRRNWPFV